MEVIALRFGTYGGFRRREGEVFTVEDNAKSTWFAPLDMVPQKPKKPQKGKGKDGPITLSQHGKQPAKAFADVMGGDPSEE